MTDPKPAPARTIRRAFAPRRLLRHGRLLVFLLVATLTALRLWDPQPLSAARLGFFDLLQRWHTKPASGTPVAIVNIDEASLARFGQWPWPRGRMAELVAAAADHGAKVLGFTILFAEPDRIGADLISLVPDLPPDVAARILPRLAGDTALAASFGRVPVVLGTAIDEPVAAPAATDGVFTDAVFAAARDPRGFLPAYRRAIGNIPPLDKASALRGALVVIPDRSGVIREAPIAVRIGEKIVPSLAAAMLRIGLDAKLDLAVAAQGIDGLRLTTGLLPTSPDGDIWLAYRRPDQKRYVSAGALLQGDVAEDALRGKYVLLGTTVTGLAEYHATPLGLRLPGLEIQAQILDAFLSGDALRRPFAAGLGEIAAPIALSLLGLALARRRRLRLLGGISFVGAVLLFPLALAAFVQGDLLLDPIYPAACFVLIGGSLIAAEIVSARRRAESMARARAERLRELQVEILNLSRLAAIEQMASALAHELNQPLAAMANFAQASLRLLQQDGAEQKAKVTGYLEKAIEQVNRAAAIISGLRNLVQRGQTARLPEDVNQVVGEAVETAMIGIPAERIAVIRDFAPVLPPVPMNRIQIQQVVLNLVRNAAEAMRAQERGTLTIRTTAAADSVEVSVADTGPGVSPDFEQQLFKPFATTKESGMGIGLSISRSIVIAHDGTLTAERNPAGGMTFRFTLPFADAMADAEAE